MISNPFKRKVPLEQKSVATVDGLSRAAWITLDNNGSIIDTTISSYEEEIRRNISINTILSKQASIINECALVIREKSDKSDLPTKNKDALKFLKWLEFPNALPAPTNRKELFDFLTTEDGRCGIAASIFTFSGDKVSTETFRNIRCALSVNISRIGRILSYNVRINEHDIFNFKYDPLLLAYTYRSPTETLLLFICGTYDIKKQVYCSKYVDAIEYIVLQNYLVKFASSFHKNACFPSQIIQLTYKNLEAGQQLNPYQVKQFEDAVNEVKLQLQQSKSANNAGGMIVPSHPSLEIEVKPLQIPTNASDNIAYQGLVSQKIYAYVDGGSSDAFEGKSEYSNNASVKLQDLYDGTFRMANSILITKLNIFMKNLFLVMGVKIDVDNCYLSMDLSAVKLYQKQIKQEIIQFEQNNILTINEARSFLGQTDDTYASLGKIKQGDVTNKELSGTARTSAPKVV